MPPLRGAEPGFKEPYWNPCPKTLLVVTWIIILILLNRFWVFKHRFFKKKRLFTPQRGAMSIENRQ